MIASRAEDAFGRPGLCAAAALALAVAATGPSIAVEGDPVPLVPPAASSGKEIPGDSEGATADAPVTADDIVLSQPLEALDLDSTGVLSDRTGGFGPDLWKGTPRALVERLLPAIPAPLFSPTERDLVRRLVMSAATVPDGPAKASLFTLRLEALRRMGDSAAIVEMADRNAVLAERDSLARIAFEARLAVGDEDGACAIATSRLRIDQDPYWQKAFIFCETAERRLDAAQLGLAALRETGYDTDKDPTFFLLAEEVVSGSETKLDKLNRPTVLHIALARLGKTPLPEDVLAFDDPFVWRAVAEGEGFPLELRLDTAEKATAAGALPVEVLTSLYGAVPFTDEQIANALTLDLSGARGRALLYRAARAEAVLTARALLVKRALDRAAEDGHYMLVARTMEPLILDIPPSSGLAWFGLDAGRVLLLTGHFPQAFDWFQALENAPADDAEAARAATRLWPLVQIGDVSETVAWEDFRLAAWWTEVANDPEAAARAEALYAFLKAVGRPVARGAWAPLVEPAWHADALVPDLGLWRAMRDAADDRAVGETVLLVVAGLGRAGPEGTHPLFVADAVESLRRLGLTPEARRLALEAAILRGI